MPDSSLRLLGYAWTYRRGWVLIFLLTLLGVGFSLAQPWPMQALVDHVLGDVPRPPWLAWLPGAGSKTGLLGWVVAAGLLFFALGAWSDVILARLWVRTGQRMVYDLAADLFARVQRRSLIYHTRVGVGDVMSRVTGDSWAVFQIATTVLFTPLHAVVMLACMILVMTQLDGGLTLLALAIAPLLAFSSLILGRPTRESAAARREIEGRIQAHVQQILAGIPVVQAFAQEDREHRQFQLYTREALRAIRRVTLVGSWNELSAGLITTLGAGGVLWLGAYRVTQGRLTVGALLVFIAYLGNLQGQLRVLANVWVTYQAARAGADRVAAAWSGEGPQVSEKPGATRPPGLAGPVRGSVKIENVTFGYDLGRPTLRGVTLEAEPGQTIAIVGQTGAGKSTLVGLIPRFFDPWEGRVLLDGQDVRDWPLADVRGAVALVLQEPFLLPITVAENIAYGRPAATREQIIDAAKAANAHEFVDQLDAGYDTRLGERGATLSGGQRQRISIARALLKDAPVLVLDEPTSALDTQTESLLLGALERLMAGRTTFIIAHRLSTIRNADRIVVMRDGRIEERGTHESLIRQGGLFADFYRVQFGGGGHGEGEGGATPQEQAVPAHD